MTSYFSDLTAPKLAELLLSDGVGVIPTDTVYGLVARAHSKTAISRLYSLKSRSRQPGTTIAASVEQLQELGFNNSQLSIARKFWPNSISVELSAAMIPDYLKTDQAVMAARIPNSPALLALLKQTGPLMTTSANAPYQPTSTTIQMAYEYFGDSVDFYVDGGDFTHHEASTIIGISPEGTVTVLRQGVVAIPPK